MLNPRPKGEVGCLLGATQMFLLGTCWTRPEATRALGGNSPMIAEAVMLFPDPLSPTSATVFPRSIANETPCTTG